MRIRSQIFNTCRLFQFEHSRWHDTESEDLNKSWDIIKESTGNSATNSHDQQSVELESESHLETVGGEIETHSHALMKRQDRRRGRTRRVKGRTLS